MLAEAVLFAQCTSFLIAEYNLESNLPQLRNKENSYPGALEYVEQSHVRFGPPAIDDPVLFIVDPIFDKDMHYIPSGYYQLALDPDRENLYLVQSGNVLAIIPVFKIEISKKREEQKRNQQMPKSFFKQKKYLIKQYFKERRRKQNIKKKRIEAEKTIYSEAEIILVPEKKYYLIKYENLSRNETKTFSV